MPRGRRDKSKDTLITADDLLPHKAKVRVTTMIDGDVLLALRSEAEGKNMAYQTLLNQILRDHCFAPKINPVDARTFTKMMEDLQESMRDLIHRELGKTVGHGRAKKKK